MGFHHSHKQKFLLFAIHKQMSDIPYLDKDAIRSASELVNSTLLSKGYVDDDILFNSINWRQLFPGQPNPEITEIVYNNDKNVINIIYSLLQSIERNKVQNRSFNKVISQKDLHIKQLEDKNRELTSKLNDSQSNLDVTNVEKELLNKKITELSNINKLQLLDLNKLKGWSHDIQNKYTVNLKQKNQEISCLKDQLLDKRNLSTTVKFGISPNSTGSTFNNSINSNLVYNNSPIISNYNNDTTLLQPVLNKEYENIVVDLTSLINSLINENFKFSKFTKLMNNYYSQLNGQLSHLSYKKELIDLPNPSEMIDLKEIEAQLQSLQKSGDGEDNEVEPFEVIIRPFLNNIYKNYHYVQDLITIINSESQNNDSEIIEKLRQELNIATKNWQDTIKTLEEWQTFKQVS